MWIKPGDVLAQGQRLFRYYSAYALALALLLTILGSLDTNHLIVAATDPTSFLLANTAYVVLTAVMLIISNSRVATHPQYAIGLFLADVTLLVLMMHASGGLGSGFSNLILVPILISNLLVRHSLGYVVAAWTTLSIFYSEHILHLNFAEKDVFFSGLYGFFCFVLAFLTQSLSNKINSTLELTYKQAKNISRLRNINRQVLISMPNAIIACDHNDQILFANKQAHEWFDINEAGFLPSNLMSLVKGQQKSSYSFEHNNQKLVFSKTSMEGSEEGDYLLLIEDAGRIASEAQQIKLASLGRLTASIAHEIRNPLSALRHAAQLLAEAPDLQETDKKLTTIIEQHCMRINRTVEDILQISRRKNPNTEAIRLEPWLQHFKAAFHDAHPQPFELNIQCPSNYLVQFDPDQLQQILHNLCNNGLRYAMLAEQQNAALQIKVSTPRINVLNIDIIDNGTGITEENQKNLFEPFFTTEHTGTGLGLYLCREICEANDAILQYIDTPEPGACFRITLQRISE